jgi:hypothetical protein
MIGISSIQQPEYTTIFKEYPNPLFIFSVPVHAKIRHGNQQFMKL